MSDYERLVPPDIRRMVALIVDQARSNLERFGQLVPVAFLGRLDGELGMCSGLHLLSVDEAASAVRGEAEKMDPDFVLFINEVWLKSFEGMPLSEAQRLRAMGGRVRDMPGRVDGVLFMLETHTGVFAAQVVRETLQGEPDRYTFGEVRFEKPQHAEGRLSGLLPPRETMQ